MCIEAHTTQDLEGQGHLCDARQLVSTRSRLLEGLEPSRESDLQQILESSLVSPQGLWCQRATPLGQAAGLVALDR